MQETKSKKEYLARINKAIDYINNNIKEDLNLLKIAKVACFSPYHFHRIFKWIIWETLNNYIKRIRLEKAGFMLSNNPNYSITEIAFLCGFAWSQTLSRDFKKHFNVTPSEFKKNRSSKIWNINSKIWEDFSNSFVYSINGWPEKSLYSYINKIMNVEIKNLPSMHVAYVRHIGPYKWNEKLFEWLFNKLCSRAWARNLFNADTKMLSAYYEDPSITDESKLRLDVCCTIPKDTEVDWEIGKQDLPSWKYAVARFEITDPKEYEIAWNTIFKDWLPWSWYQPDDRPSLEIYLNDPQTDPEGKQILDICVPVKPL